MVDRFEVYGGGRFEVAAGLVSSQGAGSRE